jgi:sulfhydrogenase subunit gamma (sulfur reductase)
MVSYRFYLQKEMQMARTDWVSMTVRDVHQETEGFLSIQLQPTVDHHQYDFRPGQYVSIRCSGDKEAFYAIASEPEEKNFIEFLVKDDVSSIDNELCRVKPDDEVRVSIPRGRGFPLEQLKGKNVLLVGMGAGLAPLRATIKSMLRNQQNFGTITLVYGLRRPQDKPFTDDFNIWAKKVKLEIAVSQPGNFFWQGFVGRVTELLPTLSLSPQNTVACICGTKEMEAQVIHLLVQAGFNKKDILSNH